MNIVLFSTKRQKTLSKGIRSVLENLAPSGQLVSFEKIDALDHWLRQPKPTMAQYIAILVATSEKDLNDLLLVRPLLNRGQIILVLPNWHLDSTNAGHQFHPRFMTSIENNFMQVEEVVKKMIKSDSPYMYS